MCTTTNEEDCHRYHRYINKGESVAGTVSGNHEAVYRAFMFGFAGQELILTNFPFSAGSIVIIYMHASHLRTSILSLDSETS